MYTGIGGDESQKVDYAPSLGAPTAGTTSRRAWMPEASKATMSLELDVAASPLTQGRGSAGSAVATDVSPDGALPASSTARDHLERTEVEGAFW